jgi:hypothetical protein
MISEVIVRILKAWGLKQPSTAPPRILHALKPVPVQSARQHAECLFGAIDMMLGYDRQSYCTRDVFGTNPDVYSDDDVGYY